MASTIELKLSCGKSVFAETADVSGQFTQLAAPKSGGRGLTDVVAEMRETLTVIASENAAGWDISCRGLSG